MPDNVVKLERLATTEISGETGGLIVSVCAPETPPPGNGLDTVTFAVPADEMSDVLIMAVSVELLT